MLPKQTISFSCIPKMHFVLYLLHLLHDIPNTDPFTIFRPLKFGP